MKFFLPSLLVLILAWPGLLFAENPAERDPNSIDTTTSEPAPAQFPMKYVRLLREATRCFHVRDFEGALRFTEEADLLVPPTPYSINVKGAVALEQKRFTEATRYFKEALKLNPVFFEAWFNLADVAFMQGNYSDARGGYLKLLAHAPRNELLIYRIYLTYLLEKNDTLAIEWKEKIPFPSETPSYHYANAAWEFGHRNKAKAAEWVEACEAVWPPPKRANFVDVLIHLGWVEWVDVTRPVQKLEFTGPETKPEELLGDPLPAIDNPSDSTK